MNNARGVVPRIDIKDAVKQKIDSSQNEYIIGKNRDNLFLTQTPQAFNIKEIFTINFCDHSKLDLSSLEDEFIEPIYNSEINFSEIAIQMFYSFLDPYPKINNGNIKLDSFYKNKFGKNKNTNNPFEVLNNLNK